MCNMQELPDLGSFRDTDIVEFIRELELERFNLKNTQTTSQDQSVAQDLDGVVCTSRLLRSQDSMSKSRVSNQEWSPSKKKRKAVFDDNDCNSTTRLVTYVQTEPLTTSDGCRWRNTGRKFTKGNPHPRVYYQCIVTRDCPVRRWIQKCAQDEALCTRQQTHTHNHDVNIADGNFV